MAKEDQSGMAVISMSGTYLLPIADALAILDVLGKAEKVEWDWSNKVYKYRKLEQEGLGSLTLLSAQQVACIALEE